MCFAWHRWDTTVASDTGILLSRIHVCTVVARKRFAVPLKFKTDHCARHMQWAHAPNQAACYRDCCQMSKTNFPKRTFTLLVHASWVPTRSPEIVPQGAKLVTSSYPHGNRDELERLAAGGVALKVFLSGLIKIEESSTREY